MSTDFHYRKRAILWLLLIVLNIVIRIPSAPHEIGGDTYQLHTLANSITQFGEARWWIHWLSVFGMYTYSYASAVPFSLSGISQLTNTEMEITVYIYSLLLGLLSSVTAYVMAGRIYNEFIFKYSMSLFYSISTGILSFTSWNASARGLYLVLFPLFVFVLLKNFSSIPKKLLLLVCLLIFLRTTHNFSYFTVPLILVFILIEIVEKSKISFKDIYMYKYKNQIFLFVTCVMFIIPFFNKLFIVGSKYQALITLFIVTSRYVGPLVMFILPGFLYLSLKNNKTKLEDFVLISTLFFIPISYSATYGKFVTLPIMIFYVSVAFKNIALSKKKSSAVIIILLICSLTLFSSFYSHFRTGQSDSYFYMSEETYSAGLWVRDSMPESTRVYTTGGEIWRMLAISEGHINVPTLPPLELIYGFVDDVSNSTNKTSPLSMEYYFEGPYVQKSSTSTWGEFQWYAYFDINDGRVKNFLEKYDLKYAIIDVYSSNQPLTQSLRNEKPLIYSDGRIEIWDI